MRKIDLSPGLSESQVRKEKGLSVPGTRQRLEGNEVSVVFSPASLKHNGQSSRLLGRFCHYQICVLIEKFIPAAVWHLEGSDNCGRLRTCKEATVLFWQKIKVAWNRALIDGFSAWLPASFSEPCRKAAATTKDTGAVTSVVD